MAKFTGVGSMIVPGEDARVYDCRFETTALSQTASILMQGARARVRDCHTLNSETGVDVLGPDSIVRDCHIVTERIGVHVNHNNALIVGNTITVSNTQAFTDARGVLLNSGRGSKVKENTIFMSGDAIGVESGDDAATVSDNYIAVTGDQIGIDVIEGSSVTGNTVRGDTVTSGCVGIRLGGTVEEVLVVGNKLLYVFHGITANGTLPTVTLISGNLFQYSEGHSIDLSAATSATEIAITDNLVSWPGQSAANTYDGIRVASDRARVLNNVIQPDDVLTRSAVNVVGGTGVIVVGNDLGNPADYQTDALIDNGTSTQLTYPSHATYGDNFT